MTSLGFFILRHVTDEKTGKLWKHCYNCIRKFYMYNNIIIIDDNSNYDYIDIEDENKLMNTFIIKSDFHKRGELLFYHYYLRNKLFDTAVFLHDSVFLNNFFDFKCNEYKFLWNIGHALDVPDNELRLLSVYNDPELIEFYNKRELWDGAFGTMMIVKHSFLRRVNEKYDLSKLLEFVSTKDDRKACERVIPCIFQKEAPMETLLGGIHDYCQCGDSDTTNYKHLPIIKVWTDR